MKKFTETKFKIIAQLILAGGIIFFANQIFAVDSTTNFIDEINKPSPFKIIVTPGKNRVHVGEKFNVELEVKNLSNTNQSIGVWSCSWDENWKSSNPHEISLLGEGGCLQNGVKPISLAPGELYKQKPDNGKEIQMQVMPSVKTNKITFRVGFTASTWGDVRIYFPKSNIWQTNQWWVENPKNTYWSDEVTININPKSVPDWIPW